MTRLRMFLMATAAIFVTTAIATTAAQATNPVLGVTPAATTTSTLGANMLPAMTLKATALQVKPEFGTTQFGTALKTLNLAGDKKAGDTKETATTGATWALTTGKAGFDSMKAQASKVVRLKAVAIIDKAKHPVISKFVPRQVLYTS